MEGSLVLLKFHVFQFLNNKKNIGKSNVPINLPCFWGRYSFFFKLFFSLEISKTNFLRKISKFQLG